MHQQLLDEENSAEVGGSTLIDELKGDIVLKDMHFSYNPGEPVLLGLNVHIKRGQTVAIVGATGSGKSTLLHCICELEPYDEGRVSMGGEVRWCILQQEPPYQKSESILDNLYSGDLDAVQALHAYTIALQNPDDATAAQLAYDNMDRTQAWDFEARGKEILGKLNLHDFGIFLEMEPDDEERAELQKNIQISLQTKNILEPIVSEKV